MKHFTLSALVVASILMMAGPSGADERNQDSDKIEIVLDASAHSGGQVAVADSPWNDCTFKSLTIDQFIGQLISSVVAGLYGSYGDLAELLDAINRGEEITDFEYEGELSGFNDVVCDSEILFEGRAIWPVGTTTPQVVVDAVVDIARSRLTITSPRPNTAPTGTADTPTVVNLPTFLWVDQSAWVPSTSTADIPGLVSVTVTATPTAVTWDLGDGSTPKTCDGPGTPWTPGVDTTDCQHTYDRSSADQPDNAFPLRATTHYDIAYTCTPLAANTTCSSNAPLGGVDLTFTTTMTVAEVQAVNT